MHSSHTPAAALARFDAARSLAGRLAALTLVAALRLRPLRADALLTASSSDGADMRTERPAAPDAAPLTRTRFAAGRRAPRGRPGPGLRRVGCGLTDCTSDPLGLLVEDGARLAGEGWLRWLLPAAEAADG